MSVLDISAYASEKRFQLSRASWGLVTAFAVIYTIIMLHGAFAFATIKALYPIGHSIIMLPWSILFVLVMIGIGMKGGFFLVQWKRGWTAANAIASFLYVNLYLAFFLLLSLSCIFTGQLVLSWMQSDYFRQFHTVWVLGLILATMCAFAFIFSTFDMFKWSALDELKSIPTVSPVFCLSGPFLLKKGMYALDIGSLPGHIQPQKRGVPCPIST